MTIKQYRKANSLCVECGTAIHGKHIRCADCRVMATRYVRKWREKVKEVTR